MKNYYLTIFLVLLVIAGLFLVFKDKKELGSITNPLNKVNNTINNKKTEDDKVSVEQGLTLTVSSPKDQSTVDSSTIQVTGKTSPNAEVFVNEIESKADSSGNFSVNYTLYEGENNIYVAVNDELGNYAEKSIIVYLETTQ